MLLTNKHPIKDIKSRMIRAYEIISIFKNISIGYIMYTYTFQSG